MDSGARKLGRRGHQIARVPAVLSVSDGDVDASGKSEGRRKVSRKRRFKGKEYTRSVQVEKAKTGLLVNR